MTTTTCRRAAALVLLALTTATACTDARPSTDPTAAPRPSTPVARSSSPVADPEAEAKAAALVAYRSFSAAASDAERHPNRPPTKIKKFATDKALAGALATVALYRQQQIVVTGRAVHDEQVVAFVMSNGTSTATIRDCVDVSGVAAVYRSTKKSALAPNKSQRHVVTAHAIVVDDRWLVRDVVADQKSTC